MSLAYMDWVSILGVAALLWAGVAIALAVVAVLVVGPRHAGAVALPSVAAFVGGVAASGDPVQAVAVGFVAALAAAAIQRLLSGDPVPVADGAAGEELAGRLLARIRDERPR